MSPEIASPRRLADVVRATRDRAARATESAAAESRTAQVLARKGARPRRILVVDDDPEVRQAVATLLESAGHEVVTACHGRHALAQLRHGTKPDLIVLDYQMPEMDGAEFRERQRRDPRLARIPVVMWSAASSPPPVAADVDDWLSKAVDPDTLVETVEKYVASAAHDR
jgi:CheY-like chemotaxis protein